MRDGCGDVPHGLVSVMPQTWFTETPSRSNPSIMLGAGAEPAMTSRLSVPAPRFSPSKCCSNFEYSVGTPAVTVTPSVSISSAMFAASIFGPGSTSFAPTIGAACVKPQAPLA